MPNRKILALSASTLLVLACAARGQTPRATVTPTAGTAPLSLGGQIPGLVAGAPAPAELSPTPADVRFLAALENSVIDFYLHDPSCPSLSADMPRLITRGIPARQAVLIRMLGAPDYRFREFATEELLIGPGGGWASYRALIWAGRSRDPEIRRRAGLLRDALHREVFPCRHCMEVRDLARGQAAIVGVSLPWGYCPASVLGNWCAKCNVRPEDGPVACRGCDGNGVSRDEE